MPPEIDYIKIGQRIKKARLAKGLTQAELGELVGCSNNHMSHMEVGQTKASLSILLKLSYALDTDLNYFLLDTPYAPASTMDAEIADKLSRCTPATLITISKMIDILLEHQELTKNEF